MQNNSSKVKTKQVEEAIYKRFIEPTTNGNKEYIGIELELPILNMDKKAVDFQIVHKVTGEFEEEFTSFKCQNIDYDGNVCSLIDETTGDIISYDCSYNNLEFSFGVDTNIFNIDKRFKVYYKFFKKTFEKYNHTITGMGINPYRKYNSHVPIPNERYHMLYHHLCSYKNYDSYPKYFHEFPEYGMFSSASQIQLDVTTDNLVKTINVFNKLEPIKAILFANSLLDERKDLICCRDMFWEDSTHGINPHNVGMYNVELESVDEVEAYIKSCNIYCTMRDGHYINFPTMNVMDYFNSDAITGEYFNGEEYQTITIKPDISDIKYLRTFKFLDLTYRGTIEYRSACQQPVKDIFTVAAFQLGLKHKINELGNILDNDNVIYHNGYNALELRKLFTKRELPSFVDEDKLYELIKTILDLSKEGLIERGHGEEVYLNPLYDRVNNRTNPAKTMLKMLDEGKTVEDIIKEYAKLN